MSNLLETLRKETRDLHNSIHEHPILLACQESCLNINEYSNMLKAFYLPWQTLLPAVKKVPIDSLQTCLFKRAEAIQSDLKSLNINPNKLENSDVLLNPSEDELIGICYVLVGSSMGASILQKKIRKNLKTVPISYLSLSPRESGWPILSSYLKTLVSHDYPKAAYAAQNVFRMIHKELSKVN